MKSITSLALLASAASAQWTDCAPEANLALSTALQTCATNAGITSQYAALALISSLTTTNSAIAQSFCAGQLTACSDLKALALKPEANCSFNTYKGSWVNLHEVIPKICGATTVAPSTAAPTTAAPTTAAPTTAAPSNTTATPSNTTASPTTAAPSKTTVAPTTAAPSKTTAAPSTASPASPHCINVSVVGDATYCIRGPICSGDGILPAGIKCPAKGDVAVASCLKTLKSYVDASKCVLPIDATCEKIPTGAWGCVMRQK